jgi:hypothetical protein
VLLSAISVVSLALATQFVDDVRYAMSPATPFDLGAGISASPEAVGANRWVILRGSASMAGAVTYSRPLAPGQHLVFPVAGRDTTTPFYVQVSQDNADALTRGEFQGRLIPFDAAGGRYARVGHFLHDNFNRAVNNQTWLLVDGATPRASMWAPFVVTLLVALALSNALLLTRLLRRVED